jgi:hypothetical protein
MVLDFATLDADVFFELARGGGEGIAQGHVKVLVGLLVMVVPAHDDVLVRDADVNSDFVEITLMLMVMFRFDSHSAADDVIAELFQFDRFFPYPGFNRIGVRDAPERNL